MTTTDSSTLHYLPDSLYCPIPPSEQGLPTVRADYWVRVYEKEGLLEGLHFNRTGDTLYFVETEYNRVMQVDMATETVSTVLELNESSPGKQVSAVKVHKDGRLFIACCSKTFETGEICVIYPDGSGYKRILDGYVVNDLVFDSKGGCYFTDFRGLTHDRTGGVYHLSADFQKVTPVIRNMAAPNGIALSKDERVLWVSETTGSRLIRAELNEDGLTIPSFGTAVVYHTTGHLGPDSICIDDDDNVYCAFFGQARAMVFNRGGWPIGMVLMPDREKGLNMRSSHPTIRPGTRELYICTSGNRGDGSCIVRAGSFAEANTQAFYLQS